MNEDDHSSLPSEEVSGASANETPVQKALRLKNAKLDGRPQAPRGGRFQREQNARIAAGKSRPWMSK